MKNKYADKVLAFVERVQEKYGNDPVTINEVLGLATRPEVAAIEAILHLTEISSLKKTASEHAG